MEGALMKILFDPGHGGDKPGAVYDPDVTRPGDETEEEDINLDVALAAGRILRDKGHAVLYTRDRDIDVPLLRRKELINEYRTDVFVSIHCNATEAHTSKGVEAFYRDDRDYPLANIIQQYLAAYTGLRDRGVFQDVARLSKRLTVLDDSADIPACLVELGFIDNEEDRMYITKNVLTVAEVLADAIHEYAKQKQLTT
jgi:N-acetylmuramoyl-L-alanine amidase